MFLLASYVNDSFCGLGLSERTTGHMQTKQCELLLDSETEKRTRVYFERRRRRPNEPRIKINKRTCVYFSAVGISASSLSHAEAL